MKRWERWSFNTLTLIVCLTGIVYLGMKYGMESGDPYSVINHPWQPLVLDLHILASPLLILVLGIIFNSHIGAKIRSRYMPNRRTGWVSLLIFLPMVLSGYLLQVLVDPLALQVTLIIHLLTGGVFALSYLVHQIISLRLRRRPLRRPEARQLAA